MNTHPSDARYDVELSDIIGRILSHLPSNADALTQAFVRHYFIKMPLLELVQLDPKQACQIALTSLPFFHHKQDRVQLRSFTPELQTHGWSNQCHAIEVHNDDHAFILDSLRAELSRQGYDFLALIHPIFFVKRNKAGELTEIVDLDDSGDLPAGVRAESFIHFQITGNVSALDAQALERDLLRVLHSVELVVDDFAALERKCDEAMREVSKLRGQFEAEELEEVRAFLEWLQEKHYVFLGYIEYDFTRADDQGAKIVSGSQLGIFKLDDEELRPKALAAVPNQLIDRQEQTELIEVTKSNRRSVVHRPVLMDYITIKRYDSKGRLTGERRFLGMFTSMVYYQSAERIPFIRRKINRTLQRANYDPMSHNGKALKAILEFYPRDELFQITQEQLFHFSIALMSLETRPDVRLLVRHDRYERFISAMVFIPRDRFNSYLREQIIQILEQHYQGKMRDFYTQLTDSPLARVHLIVQTTPNALPDVDIAAIEEQIARITNRWADNLREALQRSKGAQEAEALIPVFADAFPAAYIEQQTADQAAADIAKIEECVAREGLAIDLFQLRRDATDQFHLKIYTTQSERALSDMLPILEHFGCWVREVRPYSIKPRWAHGAILIRDFHLHLESHQSSALDARKALFEEALREVWQHRSSNDAFNGLVLSAGLSCREVELMRSYANYLRQIGIAYSRDYIAEVLNKHPIACQLLLATFNARFTPDAAPNTDMQLPDDSASRSHALEEYLQQVKNAAEDRIIRHVAALIQASLRTNYFQRDAQGNPKPYLSIKFASARVPDVPKPVPFAEIFVCSARMEGIHLRGDAVARGGLRWSDRLEDYRTEVLGLVKAQMVKNAVIVPQGAKGGFVLKQPPADTATNREALQQEAIACYEQFLSGLLDITDNIQDGAVIPPKDVVRHDGDDPYLVVAADKGTATFSDIANGIAARYHFWLGDAFASGGSVGYDHKEMAITARGAWVSVDRHFREMGKDILTQPFTVIGIGDMSGDVFGNGMLLSDKIQLIAAFNHRHIFIDPTPDATKSFRERQRLFALPRSSWADYAEKLISKGGGVYERAQKSIRLSAQAAKALGAQPADYTPDALIKIILQAPVDLLWNGGIGTYVKATEEAHSAVGDHSNNALRVNGAQLRCLVVGEGGNLGFTQRGRIEYALSGGRINTDAIDNSAGVDCSDHEVNIKITLSHAMQRDALTLQARNALLHKMTDAVAELVLIDNKLQTQAISVAEQSGLSQLEPLARMMRQLEQSGLLDRAIEYLPTDKQIAERRAQKIGMTRPELAVLLSYAKLALYDSLKDAALTEDDYFIDDLLRYFPKPMQTPYREDILAHRLRPAIVATMLTNSIINRAGITFAHRIIEETGVHPCDIARAYVLTRDAFKLRECWAAIEALGADVNAGTQAECFIAVQHFIDNSVRWFLRNCPEPIPMRETMDALTGGIAEFAACYPDMISQTLKSAQEQRLQDFMRANLPEGLARQVASLEIMASAGDVVLLANAHGVSVAQAGAVYFEIGAYLRLGWLRRCASRLASEDYWQQQALQSLIRELYWQQRRLSATLLADYCELPNDRNAAPECTSWYEKHAKAVGRYLDFVQDLKTHESVDLPMLVVALRKIEEIAALTG
jgi:glutamate dehydrogenase